MPWWMAWIWKKYRCITFVKDALKANIKKTSFPKDGATKASQFLEIVHINVCGPMRTTCMVECDTFSLSLTISQGKLMSIF
jgi:hypothetical protein